MSTVNDRLSAQGSIKRSVRIIAHPKAFVFNSFVLDVSFLYPLRTSENRKVF